LKVFGYEPQAEQREYRVAGIFRQTGFETISLELNNHFGAA